MAGNFLSIFSAVMVSVPKERPDIVTLTNRLSNTGYRFSAFDQQEKMSVDDSSETFSTRCQF